MSSERRQQEQREGSEPSGLRWFVLFEALEVHGSAQAYQTIYDRDTQRWVAYAPLGLRTVYSKAAGVSGSAGDFVICYFSPVTRRWEAIRHPSSKRFAVTNASLSQGGSVTVEQLIRDTGEWVRSGETYLAYDIFLNTADTVEEGTIVSTVEYQGLNVIDGMYCTVNDWLDE